ncbi:MAG: hypothetical protein ACOCT9_03165, partial [archaeon]
QASYLPNSFPTMNKEEQTVWNISAWELGYEKTIKSLKATPNKALVIFDTTAAKAVNILPLIELAKKHDHMVFYVVIHANLTQRITRTNDPQLLRDLEKSYAQDLKITIPSLKKNADKFLLVKNTGDAGYQEMTRGAQHVTKHVNFVREH